MKPLVKQGALFVLGVGIICVLIYFSGIDNIRQFGRLKFIPVLGALLASFGITGIIASRWGLLSNSLAQMKVARWFEFYHYFVLSRLVGFVLPKDVTDIGGRTGALNRLHDLPLSQASASVLLDRMFDLLIISLFFPVSLLHWVAGLSVWASLIGMLGLALFAAGFLYVTYGRLLARGVDLFERVLRRRDQRTLKQLSQLRLSRTAVLQAYVLSVMKFIFTGLRFVLFALALDLAIPSFTIFLAVPLAQLSYLVAFTPGGLGIYDASWFGILSVKGGETDQIMAFAVGQRVLTIAMIGLLALLSQIAYVIWSPPNSPQESFRSKIGKQQRKD